MANQEIAAVRAMLAQGPLGERSWEEMRSGYDGIGAQFPTADDVTLTRVDAGGVPAEWGEAPGAARRERAPWRWTTGSRPRRRFPRRWTTPWPAIASC
jgi:hypothetical protein